MTHSFPYPPDDPSGDWVVSLPRTASIGEVLLHATPLAVGPTDYQALVLSLGPLEYWPLPNLPNTGLVLGLVQTQFDGSTYTTDTLTTYLGDAVDFTQTPAVSSTYDDVAGGALQTSTELTVVAWIMRTDASHDGSIVEYYRPGLGNYQWQFDTFGGSLYGLVYKASGFVVLSAPTALGTGVHMVAMSFSVSNSRMRLWLDGAVDAETTASIAAERPSSATLTIGRNMDTTAAFLDGVIGHVAIWDRELTATEMGDLYNMGTTGT